MKVGYCRESTTQKNTICQEALMQELGVEKVFIDKASGKNAARRELQNMLQFVREGDTVIVESYSRLARSTRDLLDIIENLKNKGVEFISKKEAIDTSVPAGRLMLTIFAGLYQFERECMLERQAEGIMEAKKAGKYKGRKPIAIDKEKFNTVYQQWKERHITATAAREKLGIKKTTFYRLVKEYKSSNF